MSIKLLAKQLYNQLELSGRYEVEELKLIEIKLFQAYELGYKQAYASFQANSKKKTRKQK